MKQCPACSKEYPVTTKFCNIDGTELVDKPSASPPVPGGKILAGGDVTQNVSHHMETRVYNQDETKQVLTCVVSSRKGVITEGSDCKSCDGWALKEYFNALRNICHKCEQDEASNRESEYRSMVREFLGDDHLLDQEETRILEEKAIQLELPSEAKARIEAEEKVRDMETMSDALNPLDKSKFKKAKSAFEKKGDPETAFSYLGGLVVNYSKNEELAKLYLLVSVEADPEKGLAFLDTSSFFRNLGDSALKSIRKIELLQALDRSAEASQEEMLAYSQFRGDRLIEGKTLEGLIDLYFEDDQEEDEREDVIEVAKSWRTPEPADDAYLHFVEAYYRFFLGERNDLEPVGDYDLATPFLLRKKRLNPDLFHAPPAPSAKTAGGADAAQASAPQPATGKICPTCQMKYPNGGKFCGKDGTALVDDVASDPLPPSSNQDGIQTLQIGENTYAGEVKDGKPHGHGTIVAKIGSINGSFFEGNPQGIFTLTMTDGKTVQVTNVDGQWVPHNPEPPVAQQQPAAKQQSAPSNPFENIDWAWFCSDFQQLVRERVGKVDGVYYFPEIPSKKLTNALNSCNLPLDEKVVLLIDSTVFGSAKNCLLISNTGSLYIHNDWTAFQSGAHSLSWDMLRESAQQIDAKKLKQEVAFGAVSFNTTGCSLSAKQVEMIIIMVIKRLLELQVANSEG